MTDWKPNPGYMDVSPDTLIYGRVDGETRQEAIDWGPTYARNWEWKAEDHMLEYKIALTPEQALRMIIERGTKEPANLHEAQEQRYSAWAVELAKEAMGE